MAVDLSSNARPQCTLGNQTGWASIPTGASMNEILACRCCHHPLAADVGCAICMPIKPNLVVMSAVDEDAVPLAVIASETVSVLRKQLTQVKRATTGAYDPVLANETRAIANSIAKVLDSARKVIQDGADAVGAMSFQERSNLFLEWTGSLPGVYRRKLIEKLIAQNQNKLEAQDTGTTEPNQFQAEEHVN